jgi:hypothetical protein
MKQPLGKFSGNMGCHADRRRVLSPRDIHRSNRKAIVSAEVDIEDEEIDNDDLDDSTCIRRSWYAQLTVDQALISIPATSVRCAYLSPKA